LFSYWPDIADALRGGDYGRLNPLYSADFLAIDDLGAEYESDFINSKLQQLLNKRLNKWTVITSNLSLDDFSHKDERIASRLVRGGNKVIQIDATDYYLKHYSNP
jgi:DNA replication protein DnaC